MNRTQDEDVDWSLSSAGTTAQDKDNCLGRAYIMYVESCMSNFKELMRGFARFAMIWQVHGYIPDIHLKQPPANGDPYMTKVAINVPRPPHSDRIFQSQPSPEKVTLMLSRRPPIDPDLDSL